MRQSPNGNLIAIIGIVVLLCCICVVAAALGGYFYFSANQNASDGGLPPFLPPDSSTLTPESDPLRVPSDSIQMDTLQTLGQTIVPENDVYELGCRLKNICGISPTLPPPAAPLTVGAKQKFWLTNTDTNRNFQIDATLLYVTPHTYFWAEDGVAVNEDDMKALMDTFENEIYPKDREFFGSEWTPGVDGDVHIYVVYAGGIGNNIAGYFSSVDEYNPLVREDSNGHEMFVISSTQDLGVEYTYATLAHEFVHMIQWPSDRNDVSWLSEGFAEVGAFLNGYDVGGADWIYAQSPDLQLNDWADTSSADFGTHYGQSFLYLAYFLDRFGEDATKALTSDPENDLASVDNTLQILDATDPQRGSVATADDVFMDWAAAMYLMDPSVGDGRYTYHNYPGAPRTTSTETVPICPQAPANRSVYQYGIDYIEITCAGDHVIKFTGSTATSLLPINPNSGSYMFWSNVGNESDMTLTREFDFANAAGPITLAYNTWYDLEKDYDYVYLEVSEDGEHWQILTTPSGTAENPSGNSYGWGYNGESKQWVQEEIDLSQYAGKKVQIRFEYITDAAVNGEGFLLDDVSIDAINYQSDFETDDGGWKAEGFARVQNVLPQTFRLSLIIQGAETTVQDVPLNPDQTAEIPLSLQDGESATLIVTGTSRYTHERAIYQFEIK